MSDAEISWDNIHPYHGDRNDIVLKFNYPFAVIRAKLARHDHREDDVVVKFGFVSNDCAEYLDNEYGILQKANSYHACNVVRALGRIRKGAIPQKLMNHLANENPQFLKYARYPAIGFLEEMYDSSIDIFIKVEDESTPILLIENKIYILMEICKGLVDLHTYDIIHGDLKPQNCYISVNRPFDVAIGDFGLSLHQATTKKFNLGESIMEPAHYFQGTLRYAALGNVIIPFPIHMLFSTLI
jgi:serine/threonine protein kinase